MEEILDIEELLEDVVDENLKDFMKKDEETEKLLNDKIDELAKEEEKLTKKEEELKSLEESSREKISTNASADELIEIAGKIKEVEEELSSINENIKKYSDEKEELINTKNSIEKSKKDYIKSLKDASSNYDEQLKKISEAIEVCDNPTLKQVLSEVETKRTTELSELEEKRISELRSVLKEEEPVEESKESEVIIPEIEEKQEVVELPKVEESTIEIEPKLTEEVITPIVEEPTVVAEPTKPEEIVVPKVEDDIVMPVIEPAVETPVNPTFDSYSPKSLDDLLLNNDVTEEPKSVEEQPVDNLMNLDTILDTTPNMDLNVVQPDDLVIPEINPTSEIVTPDVITPAEVKDDNQVRIIYEKEVPNNLLKDIYSSSKIMPSLNSFLEGSNN